MAPVNLPRVNSEGFKRFLSSFDHVFSDCDGVLWVSEKVLPGVGDFFRLMKQNGKTVHFVSNNSIRTKEDYTTMFKKAGILGGFENLTIPSIAMAEYLKSVKFDKHIYCVTCPETKKMFEKYGFKTKCGENLTIPSIAMAEYLKSVKFDKHIYCVTCPETKKMFEKYGFKTKCGPDVGHDNFAEFTEYFIDDYDIGAVAFDNDYKANLAKMYKASTYLRKPEVLFLNGPTDKYVPIGKGLAVGTTWPTDLVSDVVKRQPIGLGKPSKDFGEFAMRRAGVTDPNRVLFIGDMIAQDVCLGKNTGFKTLLVLTHHTEEEMRASEMQPDFFAPDLGSVVPKFNEK